MYKKYYDDPGLTELQTVVEQVKKSPEGIFYSFKESIIYPGGGGQIPDKAKVNNCDVIEIQKVEDFTGFKLSDNCEFEIGENVKLEIDADFRQYNRQQHTAQHVISAVMDNLGFKTVSVHLGEEYTLIEVEGGIPDDEKVQFIEKRSNEIIRQALPVKTEWLNRDDALKLPLRKKPGVYEKLRIVSIDNVDFSACGGTHVENTAHIGLIKFINLEKIRGNARLQFLVGNKAYIYFNMLHIVQRNLVRALQSSHDKLEQRVQDILSEKAALSKNLADLKKKLLPFEVNEIIREQADESMIACDLEDSDQAIYMAKELFNRSAKPVLVTAVNRFYYLCNPESDTILRDFIKEQGALYDMRGGGPAGFIQGMFNVSKKNELTASLKTIVLKNLKD